MAKARDKKKLNADKRKNRKEARERPQGRPAHLPPDGPDGPPNPDPDAAPLSADEQRFVDEWLVDRNQTLAVLRAFPDVRGHREARGRGSDYAGRPHVRAEMRAVRHAQRLRCRVNADEALEEMARLAFSDILGLFDPRTQLLRLPRHIPLQVRKAISSVKISRERRTVVNDATNSTRTTVTDSVIEYKLWDKNAALARLWEYLGLKTTIPPLEALLSLLPAPMRDEVRRHMGAGTAPSTNGNGKH